MTHEVENHIRDGLKDVKVLLSIMPCTDLQMDLLNVFVMLHPNFLGGDVVPIHVRRLSGSARLTVRPD